MQQMRHAATVYDIAEEARTSVSTVSRVLNGSHLVTDEVSDRVRSAAERLSYTPRRIRRPRKRAILHIVVFLPYSERPQTHLFYDAATLFTGIRSGFGDVRHHLIVSLNDTLETVLAKKLGDIDGCIFAFCTPSADVRQTLIEREIPTVLINRRDEHLSWVSNDVAHGMASLVDEIHTKRPGSPVAYLSVADVGPVGRERSDMFAAVCGGDSRVECFPTVAAIHSDRIHQLYREGVRVFACVNDYVAVAVLERLHLLGLTVPGDVAIVGYDNAPVLQLVTPRMTTVDLSVRDLGARASGLLCERILERTDGHESVLVAGSLIRGDTL